MKSALEKYPGGAAEENLLKAAESALEIAKACEAKEGDSARDAVPKESG